MPLWKAGLGHRRCCLSCPLFYTVQALLVASCLLTAKATVFLEEAGFEDGLAGGGQHGGTLSGLWAERRGQARGEADILMKLWKVI
jgi:hypothetical protein